MEDDDGQTRVEHGIYVSKRKRLILCVEDVFKGKL